MKWQDYDALDGRTRKNALALKPHVTDLGSHAYVTRKGKRIHVYLCHDPGGTYDGHWRCGLCQHEFTEERPCQDIAAVGLARGDIKPQPIKVHMGDFGVQMDESLRREWSRLSVERTYQYMAAFLACVPKEWYQPLHQVGGRRPVHLPAVIYCAFHWMSSGHNMVTATQEMANGFHRPILREYLNYEWDEAKETLERTGFQVDVRPFSENVLVEFLDHPQAAEVLDRLLAVCGLLVEEFESIGGGDGTGFSVHAFSSYAEERIRWLNRMRRRKGAKDKKKDAKVEVELESTDETMTAAPHGFTFLDLTKDVDMKEFRRRMYRKVIPFVLYRTNVVTAVITHAQPGSEAPYGVPLALFVNKWLPKLRVFTWDAGYIKHALSLFGHLSGVHQFVDRGDGENTEMGNPTHRQAKRARVEDLQRMEADPKETAMHHGWRQNLESFNSMHYRIFSTQLRCQPFEYGGRDEKGKLIVVRERLAQQNEVRLHYLGMNLYCLARWSVVLAAQHRSEGTAPTYRMWGADLTPKFDLAFMTAQAKPWVKLSDLVEKYGGATKDVSDRLLADYGKVGFRPDSKGAEDAPAMG